MIVFSWRLSALVIYSVAGRQPGSNSIWQYSVKRVGDNAFLKIPKFFKKCGVCFLGAIQRFSQILAYQHKESKAIWYSFVWTDKTFAIQKKSMKWMVWKHDTVRFAYGSSYSIIVNVMLGPVLTGL